MQKIRGCGKLSLQIEGLYHSPPSPTSQWLLWFGRWKECENHWHWMTIRKRCFRRSRTFAHGMHMTCDICTYHTTCVHAQARLNSQVAVEMWPRSPIQPHQLFSWWERESSGRTWGKKTVIKAYCIILFSNQTKNQGSDRYIYQQSLEGANQRLCR